MTGLHFLINNKGVSETVGFIIIFGIVITGISLVTLLGYPALLNQQQEANIRNMEKNFIVLQVNANNLAYKNLPYQETVIQVTDGTLTLLDANSEYRKKFTIADEGGIIIDNFIPGELRYLASNNNIIIGFQNGAIVKWQVGGSTMLGKPRWYYDSVTQSLVINLIQLRSDSPSSFSGIGTVTMEMTSPGSPTIKNYDPPQDITITYSDTEGDYIRAWRNYFNEFSSTGTTTVTIPDIKTLVIKEYTINVKFN